MERGLRVLKIAFVLMILAEKPVFSKRPLQRKDSVSSETESVPGDPNILTDSTDKNVEFPYAMFLDFDLTVHLRWNFDSDNIFLQLIVPTRGWIGIGFSHTASMIGADLIMAGVRSEEPYVLDAHSEENGLPSIDESQDVKLLSGWENATHTSVTVTRKRISCDEDDMKIIEGTYKVIWAYGGNDINPRELIWNNYHQSNRGGKNLKLINPAIDFVEKAEEELKYFDIRPINFKVPAQDTYYLCQYFEIPLKTKHHVVKHEPYITKGNEKNIHHIIIRFCDRAFKEPESLRNGTCYVDIHPFLRGCQNMFAGWAIGSTGTIYPQNTGLSVGDPGGSRYVLMEMHYDNPNMEEFLDSSGIRFHYTEIIREHDIGTFAVMHDLPTFWIPPRAESYKVNGHCTDTCLSRALTRSNLQEVTVIGSLLHAHLAGSAIKLHHSRNGSAIKPIAIDEHYDSQYQEYQYIEDGNVKLKSGDSLRVECSFNTLDRMRVTPGGYSTREEMCVAFVVYYPAMHLNYCNSREDFFKDLPGMDRFLRNLNITISNEEMSRTLREVKKSSTNANDKLLPLFNQVQWTKERREFAEDYMNSLYILPICVADNDWLAYLQFLGVDVPVSNHEEWVEDDVCLTNNKHQPEKQSKDYKKLLIISGSFVLLLLLSAKLKN